MRPLETLLLFVVLLVFLAVAFRRPQWVLAPLALLLSIAQISVEGARWQIIPAYAMLLIFGGLSLRQRTNKPSPLLDSVLIVLGILGLAISIALLLLLPVFRFPAPSGPYQIGTVTYHWRDEARPEILTATPTDLRELMIQIWYPAEGTPASPRALYLPEAEALAEELHRLKHFPELLFSQLKYVQTNAIPAAPAANDQLVYPVLLFLEGAIGVRQISNFQVEELVSHGYIVVAIDQPYTAASILFPDGRYAAALPLEEMMPLIHQSYRPAETAPTLRGQPFERGIVPYLAQDVVFTLNQLTALNQDDPNKILTGKLDLQRVGTFGVSLGGIVGGEACRIEPRLRACLIMDAPATTDVVQFGLQQPTMWITRDAETMRLERHRAGGWSEEDIHEHQTTMRATFEGLRAEGYLVQISGMFHINLTDVPYWSPLLSSLGVTGPIDGLRAFEIINAYSVAFFDLHLKGLPAGLLKAPRYPEVTVEIHPR